MKEIKPCPFCGEAPLVRKDFRYPYVDGIVERIEAYVIVCPNKKCIIYDADYHYFRTPEKAIEAWNRRGI